ncbi:hypothetical protein D9757_002435 [Collybiopsis confluens]|uniref:Glutathione peroxidase n=1 Tax=Collybiopsis confluens TaxID=2823264 RepID=A0A8H5HXL7_9AGAR|nr:hypothetical protein D9757_002435 [Collybiopsis confluens]
MITPRFISRFSSPLFIHPRTFHRPSHLVSFYPRPLYNHTIRSHTMSAQKSGFYSLKAELPGSKVYDFADLQGKVVLIANTASECGFTPQYKGASLLFLLSRSETKDLPLGLQELYSKYKDQDFVLLGFPCNQFGGQEPLDDDGIAEFCTLNHGVTFPLMKKSDVNGDNTNEVYKWLKSEKSGVLGLTRIKWNFEKFLIDKKGNVVNRWASTTTPAAIDAEIAKQLKI